MSLKEKRIALLLENTFEDAEVIYPCYRLREEGAEVALIGPQKSQEYRGKHGYPFSADLGIDEANAVHFDAVIVPGGFSPDFMRRTQKMIDFVRTANQAGKIIAGICHGPWVLISAGCVRGKRATSFFAIKDDMVNAGASWVDEEVVRDGNLITSRKPADLPAFCRTIIGALREQKNSY